jgi:hypothetical protein
MSHQLISRHLRWLIRAFVVAAAVLGGAGATAQIAAAHPRPAKPARSSRHQLGHRKHKARRQRRGVRHANPAKPPPSAPLGSGSAPLTSSGSSSQPAQAAATSAQSLAYPMLFAPGSVWNSPLAFDAALDPGSATMVSGLSAEVSREEGLRIGPWITVGANVYVVGPAQPTVLVRLDNPTGGRAPLQAAFTAVPIPPGAQPGSDADAELTVSQPSTDRLWEFFHMRLQSDGWHAAWGGAMQDVSRNPGYYDTTAWPGATTGWGATASSLPHAAGVITLSDVERGQIDHALAINLPYPCQSIYSWPAQRTDGTGTAANCIPEGTQLRIDPRLDIAALHLPTMVQMMALAAQKYGMIVRDQTHWAIGFWVQSPASAGVPNPFYGTNGSPSSSGPFQGLWPNQLLSYFPWNALHVLKMSGPGL